MIDIGREEELISYLRKINFISTGNPVQISEFGGGVSCKVIQVKTNGNSFVIKQALSKLKVKDSWYSDRSRIINERKCLEVYQEIIPDFVPGILYHDDANYLFIMESISPNAIPWKNILLKGKIDYDVGRKISFALAKVHEHSSGDSKIKNIFNSDKFFIELRIEPYLETIKQKHPALNNLISQAIYLLLTDKTVLVHGDYSPKNILVLHKNIFILDFEVAHWGNPIFDLAFLTNHLLLKSIKNPRLIDEYLGLMIEMVNVYFENRGSVNRAIVEKDTINLLALLFLARVDGKSPAEYIEAESDKKAVRELSYSMLLEDNYEKYEQLPDLFKKYLLKFKKVEELDK